ncbi:MAG: histidine phosphatase family protein [Rhodopirellula sp.]|nr:histidine phosphatase family protein [Rhodopirellula sp.]
MPSQNRTTLYLIRHGATASNEQIPPILQGSGVDSPLSDLGRRQAEATGNLLANMQLDAVFSSPMARARSTAEAIAAPHGLAVSTIAELHEIDVGQWERMDWGTIARQTPEAYRLFMEDSGCNGYLGGESYQDVLDRVLPAFQNLVSEHSIPQIAGRHIAIVAHKAVNRSLLANLLGIEMRRAKDLPQDNCCINVITSRGGELKLKTLNSALHVAWL